ncbi:hypothetical protein MJD09_13015, partial [bacterium]|nr:hypothetical protein [bacterium]
MNPSVVKKLERGITLGLILGVLTGFAHFLWFLLTQNYRFEEIRFGGINLLYGSVHECIVYALIGCVIFIILWLVIRRLEGLILAALLVGAMLIPMAYLINVRFLPGFRETTSLIGNGLMGLFSIGVTIVIFKKWMLDKRFVELVTGRYLLTATIVLYVGSLAAYRFQPTHRQLYLTPDSPKALLEILDVVKIREALGIQNGIAPSDLLKQYFEFRTEERLVRLREKVGSRDTTAIIAHADSILKRKFTFVGKSRQLSQKIDWRRNPTSDKVWLYTLNRQEWLWDIAAAYLLRNDPRYAAVFQEILTAWFEQNPRMDWKNEADPVWRLM